jgi:hypothetical protein
MTHEEKLVGPVLGPSAGRLFSALRNQRLATARHDTRTRIQTIIITIAEID